VLINICSKHRLSNCYSNTEQNQEGAWWHCKTYVHLILLAASLSEAYKRKETLPGFLDACNLALDGLAEIIRSFSLAETIVNDKNVLGIFFLRPDRYATRYATLTSGVSGCFSAPTGRSTRVIQQVLLTMSTTQIYKLKSILTGRENY